MNADWIKFLTSNSNLLPKSSDIKLSGSQELQNTMTAPADFSILKVSGTDASSFLQGQLTCNISELTETNSFFTAFCNAKGRTVCTLLIIKTGADFLLILPTELFGKVSQKMQMYIMRSEVQLNNVTDELCFIGVNAQTANTLPSMPETDFAVAQNKQIFIKFPLHGNRYLVIASPSQAISLWTDLTKTGFTPCHSNSWGEQDILAGIPWLTQDSSEEYIPQMLNIDKLGGISFNKGCYTGQEIVARTHYLGKAKRELFLAYCENNAEINSRIQIKANNNEQTIGKILSLIAKDGHIKMLIVIPSTDAELNDLRLNNSNQDKITIKDFR